MVSFLVIGIMGPHTCMPCMRTHAFLSGPYPQARQRALQSQAGWLDEEPADDNTMDIIEAQLPRPCHNHKAIFTRPVTRQILAGVFGPGFLSMDAQAPGVLNSCIVSRGALGGTHMGTINGLASYGFIFSRGFICCFSYGQETPCTNKLLHA